MSNKEFEPFTNDIIHKEIDLIQSVITRMSDRQTHVKSFCLTMLGLVGYLAKSNGIFITISLSLIVLCGSILSDCFYLKTERLYRMWFDFLRDKRTETKEWLYELNPIRMKNIMTNQKSMYSTDPNTIKVYTSNSILTFYGILISSLSLFYLTSPIYQLLLQPLQSILIYWIQ